MTTRKTGVEETRFYNSLQRAIELEKRSRHAIRKKEKGDDIRVWLDLNLALLEDVLTDVKCAQAGQVTVRRLLKESAQTQDICQNPGLKRYFQFKTHTLKRLVEAARKAA